MGIALRQSTASQEIKLGPFVDSTDGVTPENALTIANTDIKLWKNGTTTQANKNSGGGTYITSSNGHYHATLDATDTDTVGPMIVDVYVTGALPCRLECHVYEEAIFDALFGSGAAAFNASQRVDVGSWLGTAVTTNATTNKPDVDVFGLSGDATAADNLESEYDGTGYKSYVRRNTAQAGAASSITLDASASATNSLYNGLSVSIISGTGVGQSRVITAYTGSTKVATVTPSWTTNPASGSVFVLHPAHVNVASWILSAPNGLATGRVDASVGAMGANVITASAINTGAITSAKFAASAIDATAIAANAITSAKIATDAIGAAQLATDAVAEIADGVWDEPTAGHVTASTFGEQCGTDIDAILVDTNALNDTKVPDTISLANINAEVDTALADVNLDHLVGTAAPGNAPAGTYLDILADDGTATYDRTTDSLQAIRDRGDAAWTSGAGSGLTPLASGTAQAGTASTIQLAAGETFADDELNGNVVKITSGTGAGQSRVITDYTGATDTATVTPNWITNPSSDSVYEVVEGSANLTALSNDAQSAADLKDFADAGYDPATNKVEGVKLVDTTTTNTDMRGTDSALLASSAPTNFSDMAITVTTGQVTVGTNNDKTGYSISGTKTTLDALNDVSTAEVNTEVDTALVDIGLDHLLAAAVIGTDVTDNSALARLVSKSATADWDDFVNTTDSLQAQRDNIGTPAGADIATDLATIDTVVDGIQTDLDNGTDGLGAIKTDTAAILADTGTDGVVIAAAQTVATVTTLTGHTPQTGDSFARLGAPAGASVSADIAAIQGDLPSRLTKNTAYSNFTFMMLNSVDNVTPKTGETVTAQRSIDGAAFGACANAVTEIANGWYKIDLAASDLNGDNIALKFTSAGASATNISIITQST